jgi:raffinose/stachyose/melibiose transport system permease protein
MATEHGRHTIAVEPPRRGRLVGKAGVRRRRGLPSVPWLIAVPGIFCLLAYHLIPTLAGSWYAFTDWDGLTDAKFVGLDNFRELFRDPVTSGALWHTLYLAGAFFVLVNVFGLALAMALNRTLKSRNLLRAVFFAPVVMSPLAVSFIWQYIFDYRGGLNQLLTTVGLESWQRTWLGDPQFALWMILIVLVWQFSGLTMVIYLAGLQSIPNDLIEAAAVDGATVWTRFRRVVLPLLAPAITVNATLTLIFGLRVFDHVIALTGGGPLNATETLATQVWKQTFVEGRYGYGAASALILTALIAALALAQLAVLRARESRI